MENMKLLEARQNEIVEEFSMFGDWMEKYEQEAVVRCVDEIFWVAWESIKFN